MATKENVYRLYPNLGYWLMIFIPLTIAGFYVTYFSQLDLPQPTITHIHFFLMGIWMALVIIQPLLIRSKKIRLHRSLGKFSYVILPLVALSTWLMIKQSYALQLSGLESDLALKVEGVSLQEGRIKIASFLSIAFVYLLWLMVFYGLAVWNRKKSSAHARYMLAAVLTFMGPTVDRILIFQFEIYMLGPGLPAQVLGFFLIDLILAFLLIQDIRLKKNPIPYSVSLGIYLVFQFLQLYQTESPLWEAFVRNLLQ